MESYLELLTSWHSVFQSTEIYFSQILPDSIQALSVVSTHGVIIADLFLLYKHHLLTKQSVHHMIKIKGRKTEDVQGIKQLNAGQNTEILTYKKNW